MDRRELIIDRLELLLGGVPNVTTVLRNRGELKGPMRPAIVLLDAGENVSLRQSRSSRGGSPLSVAIVIVRPQIFVVLKDHKPTNEVNDKNVGTMLNEYRMNIIKAIHQDATLVNLITSNGFIEYEGCESDLQNGSTLEGVLRMNFAFGFPLLSEDITTGD